MRQRKSRTQDSKKYARNLHGIFDLGRIPVKNIEVAKPETGAQFRERLAREEQEKIDRPIREVEAKINATMQALHKEAARFWALPLSVMRTADSDAREASFVDLGLPTVDEYEDPRVVARAARKAFDEFICSLPQLGYLLGEGAELRFGTFCQSQALNGVSFTPASLRRMFDWLVQWNAFESGEIEIDEQKVAALKQVEQPAPTRMTFDDAVKVADGSRESDQHLRTSATNDFIFNEAKPMIDQWVQHLLEEYNYTPSDKQRLEFFAPPHGYFHLHGLSFVDPKSYDRLRRWAVGTGRFPSYMLSAEEACSELLKKGLIPFLQFQRLEHDLTRRGIWNRSRRYADELGLIPRIN